MLFYCNVIHRCLNSQLGRRICLYLSYQLICGSLNIVNCWSLFGPVSCLGLHWWKTSCVPCLCFGCHEKCCLCKQNNAMFRPKSLLWQQARPLLLAPRPAVCDAMRTAWEIRGDTPTLSVETGWWSGVCTLFSSVAATKSTSNSFPKYWYYILVFCRM